MVNGSMPSALYGLLFLSALTTETCVGFTLDLSVGFQIEEDGCI